VVRHALTEAVDRVKCMTGIRRWHFPQVMRLVYCCVDEAMVQATVNPVDEAVGEEDEGEYRQYNAQPTYTKTSFITTLSDKCQLMPDNNCRSRSLDTFTRVVLQTKTCQICSTEAMAT